MKHFLLYVLLTLVAASCSSTPDAKEATTSSATAGDQMTEMVRKAKYEMPPAALSPNSNRTMARYGSESGYDGGSGGVEYYNPHTGHRASYDLDVDYDGSGDVDRLTFGSGGYIDQTHITDQEHNGDGTITITTDRGQEFTVDEENGRSSGSSEEESEDDE